MNNQFSENLKKIRKEHNLSQEQLANKLGVSRQAISKWESAVAYPEMDKIISLCDKFNLNIDDLLHKDIKEVKGEEESKKKINNLIDGFLEFTTDTINLFSNMSLNSKIKCLFEQTIILFILLFVSAFISNVLSSLFTGVLYILPDNIEFFIKNLLESIIVIFCMICSGVILVHAFKTRYLDYYNKSKKDINNNIEKNNNTEDLAQKNKNIVEKQNKIIIRDPKHSEYKFINGLFKIIIGIIKLFSLYFAFVISFILICLFAAFILSFFVYKTGIFFIGLLVSILASSVITIILLLLILNFVFNRKNNKKRIIWSFIISLVFLGIGIGMIFIGTLNFDFLENNESMSKIKTTEQKMNDNLIIYPHDYMEINYIESDIDNIKIDYSINELCDIKEYINEDNILTAWPNCKNPTKLIREFIKNANNKKIIPIDGNIEKMTVYANKTNIEKLKANRNNYISNR